jgi:hypothetical protein
MKFCVFAYSFSNICEDAAMLSYFSNPLKSLLLPGSYCPPFFSCRLVSFLKMYTSPRYKNKLHPGRKPLSDAKKRKLIAARVAPETYNDFQKENIKLGLLIDQRVRLKNYSDRRLQKNLVVKQSTLMPSNVFTMIHMMLSLTEHAVWLP